MDTNKEVERVASSLGWLLGELLVQIIYNGHGKILAGTQILYKKVGNGGGAFICPLGTFATLVKSKDIKNLSELNGITINLMAESKVIPLSCIKPIQKPAK